MKLRIIRHADPDYSIDGLTAAGHLEAAALGQRSKGWGLTQLFASTMGRAQLTASYIAMATQLAVSNESWVRELDEWGMTDEQGTISFPWNYFGGYLPEFMLHRKEGSLPDYWLSQPELLAQYEMLVQASDDFLQRLGYERVQGGVYRSKEGGPINHQVAVVCHGGFGLAWLSHLLQLPLAALWAGVWLAPSSVTTLLFEHRDGDLAVPRCIELSDTSHLHASGLPIQPSGLQGNVK